MSIHKVNVGVAIVGVAVANIIKTRPYTRPPVRVAIVVVTVANSIIVFAANLRTEAGR